VAVPPVVVTTMEPDGPDGAAAVMVVGDTTVKLTEMPPIVTEVTLLKLVPVIVIIVPAVADVGAKELMVGAGR